MSARSFVWPKRDDWTAPAPPPPPPGFNRRAAALGSLAALLAAPALEAAIAAPNPDAELLAACAQLPRLTALVNSGLYPEGTPGWKSWNDAWDTINEWECETLEGVYAKFRAAVFEATGRDGEIEIDGTSAGEWAIEAITAFLRLTGRAA